MWHFQKRIDYRCCLGRDKKMYQSSRIMRSMQYVFEGNVVRIWRDDLLGDAAAAIDASISKKTAKSLESKTSLLMENSGQG